MDLKFIRDNITIKKNNISDPDLLLIEDDYIDLKMTTNSSVFNSFFSNTNLGFDYSLINEISSIIDSPNQYLYEPINSQKPSEDIQSDFNNMLIEKFLKGISQSIEGGIYEEFSPIDFCKNYYLDILKDITREREYLGYKFELNSFGKGVFFICENFFNVIEVSLSNSLSKLEYSSNQRGSVERIYTSPYSEINKLLVALHSQRIIPEIESFILNSLQEFLNCNNYEICLDEDLAGKIYIIKDNKKTLLADKGYGSSNILPIILKIALIANIGINEDSNFFGNYKPKLYIIEEPETNLHPNLQSKLADLFIEAGKKFNIQFIIETHSEYLIRKLQYLTAKKEITPKDTVIYYFHHPDQIPEGQKQVKRIDILEDGSLSDDFGPGFFDEAINLKIDLLRLKNQKN